MWVIYELPDCSEILCVCEHCEGLHRLPANVERDTLMNAVCNPLKQYIVPSTTLKGKSVFSALKGRAYDIGRKKAKYHSVKEALAKLETT